MSEIPRRTSGSVARMLSSAPGGRSWARPPGRMKRVVHPQPGDQLEELQDLLALPEADRHHGQRADLHAAGGQRHQVRGDPVQLHQQDPDHGRPLGDVVGDPEQLLDPEAVRGLGEQRSQVVHPGAEGDALRPGPELHVLLDPGVQVADPAPGLGHRLAVDLEDQPEHAVRGRVLRAHVDDDPLLAEAGGLLGDLGPVAAGRGEDPALGDAGVGVRRSQGSTGRRVVAGRRSWSRSSAVRPPGVRAAGWSRPCTPPGCRPAGSPCAAGGRASRPASRSGSAPGGRRTGSRRSPRSPARASRPPGTPRPPTGCAGRRPGRSPRAAAGGCG